MAFIPGSIADSTVVRPFRYIIAKLTAMIRVVGRFVFRQVPSGAASGYATIEQIEGNTVAWNQRFHANNNPSTVSGVVATAFNADRTGYRVYGTPSSSEIRLNIINTGSYVTLLAGHKYLLSITGGPDYIYIEHNTNRNIKTNSKRIISNDTSSTITGWWNILVLNAPLNVAFDYNVYIQCYDLTLIFGAGNEPSTVAEFEEWMAQNIGSQSYFDYNAGELLSVKMESLKSIGFNQWDEEWEKGIIDSNGQDTATPNTRRSKNYIPILPGMEYFWCVKNHTLPGIIKPRYYDGSKNYIGAADADGKTSGTNVIRRMPANARYFRFWLYTDDYGSTTYQNDICINISDTSKNGTYEPYQSDSADIDVTTITGINTSTNVREVIFADGMNKASDNDVDIIDLTTDTAEKATFVLPNTYQELEYIESSGTQYINTGIYTSDNMSLKVTFAFIENVASTKRVFGKITGSTGSAINYREIGTNFYWFQAISNSDISSDLLKHTLEFSANGKLYRDGVEIGTKGTYSGVVNNPILLFAEISDGDAINYGKVQIYEWEVRNGDLVQKFIPARRIADSVLGMYDVVSGTFFTNAGTGNFIAGVNAYKAHALDTPVTYTDLQDQYGNPLNPRYKVEQGGTEQVLPTNTSTPTTVAPTLTTIYTKDVH